MVPDAGKWILNVVTVDGARTTHHYDVPGNQLQAARLIRDVSERIMQGFSGRRSVLRLDYPLVTYNPDHIVRIEFGAFTPEQWARALEDAKRRAIGFRTS